MKIITFIFSVLLSIIYVPALHSEDYPDTEGKDFWVTFIPNYHQMGYSDTDSLIVFIAASKPTKGKIEYKNRFGKAFVNNFVISDISKIYSFGVVYNDFELLGVNDGGEIDYYDAQTAQVAKPSFHISSDDDITVYACTQALKTSEACIVLPTEVLGTNYIMLGYNSDIKETSYGGINSQSTPSQFAIVATEDNTTVTITPSDSVFKYAKAKHEVQMNKGECYLEQSDLSVPLADLTGSLISADKPIAVFSGHQRATIPIEMITENSSRDCLFEQMLPTKYWGRKAFIIPFAQSDTILNPGNDIYRVLSSTDNNNILIDDIKVATLAKGEFYEAKITTAKYVKADAPILIAQYKQTSLFSTYAQYPQSLDSDPLMILVPPKEQFVDSCRVLNMQTYNYYSKVYTEQYISVVTPNIAGINVTMDNVALSSSQFTPIGNSGYSYANLAVSDGPHLLKSPFGLMALVYGYGEAVSYGYLGGMSFKSFDLNAPKVNATTSCYSVDGFVTDTLTQGTGCLTVGVNSTQNNVIVDIDSVGKGVSHFKASLVDQNKDGSFTLTSEGYAGIRTVTPINIPGLTISATKTDLGLYMIDDFVDGDTISCYELKLYNLGKFEQIIDGFSFKNKTSELYVDKTTKMNILPGDSISLNVCCKSEHNGTFSDVLLVNTLCGSREMASINLKVVLTISEPELAKQIVLSPNPAKENLNLSIRAEIAQMIDYSVYNEDGRIMLAKKNNCIESGTNNLLIDVSGFPPGVYFLETVVDESKCVNKFVVER